MFLYLVLFFFNNINFFKIISCEKLNNTTELSVDFKKKETSNINYTFKTKNNFKKNKLGNFGKDKKCINANVIINNNNFSNVLNNNCIEDEIYRKLLFQRMIKSGVSIDVAKSIIKNAKNISRPKVLQTSQPEVVLNFNSYIGRYKFDKLAIDGVNLYNENKKLIEEIGDTLKVNPEVIIAIWGVETRFGNILGNYKAIDTLFTLGNCNSRNEFFIQNLIYLAKLIDRNYFNINVQSSWAGALGQAQFMPESYAKYSLSYSLGKADLFNKKEDVFSSIANFLLNKDFLTNTSDIICEVVMNEKIDTCLAGFDNYDTIANWNEKGLKLLNNNCIYNKNQHYYFIITDINRDEFKDKRGFLVSENMLPILAYNKSINYALMVLLLAKEIKNNLIK